MWIVKLAPGRPHTFVVMALLILLLGVAAVKKTPTDVFPGGSGQSSTTINVSQK